MLQNFNLLDYFDKLQNCLRRQVDNKYLMVFNQNFIIIIIILDNYLVAKTYLFNFIQKF